MLVRDAELVETRIQIRECRDPDDDKSQLRIRLEAEAVLSVIDLVETGTLTLISSDALRPISFAHATTPSYQR